MNGDAIAFLQTGDIRHVIANAGRNEGHTGALGLMIGERRFKEVFRVRQGGDRHVPRFDAVRPQFLASKAKQLQRGDTVATEESVQCRRACVARLSGVAEQNTPAAAREDERGAETSWTAPDNDDVEHAPAELQATGHPPVRRGHKAAMNVSDFDFELPDSLIAQHPSPERGRSRLLVLRRTGSIEHVTFDDLDRYLAPRDLLVLNNTRVVPARLLGRRVPTGGVVECLLLNPEPPNPESPIPRPDSEVWDCLVHPGQKLKPGAHVIFEREGVTIEGDVLSMHFQGRRTIRLRTDYSAGLAEAIDRVGHIPLPPYIKRHDEESDKDRYQTVYAHDRGSVAAPTAGLHFTTNHLAALAARGIELAQVTLHVGYGTFKPVKVEHIEEHVIEAERYTVGVEAAAALTRARRERRRIIAVGTTTVRTLESLTAASDGAVVAGSAETKLFIHPGHQFQLVNGMITNFHLPRSSLLMLVSAFAGRERLLAAYREAVETGYRFYSYGDAMLIL